MHKFYYILPLLFQKLGRAIFSFLFYLFLDVEIYGDKDFLKHEKPLIFASNHTHELDPVVFSLILPYFSKFYPLYFVSNPQERYKSFGWRSYFYGGQFFNMLGAYQIFSEHKNYAYSLQNHINLLKRGFTVCIFPEGKRTRDGNFLEAHGGTGFLSFTCTASVLPISINTLYGLTLKDFLFKKKKLKIFIGKVIEPKDLFNGNNPKVSDFKDASQKIMNIIEENFKKL